MHDRFEDLRTFVIVVQSRSLAAASRRIGVAKSAVTRRIQELETRLGAQLLNRTTRTFGLTEAGHDFFQRATSLLADLEEAEAIAARATVDPAGRLRVSAPMSFGAMHLAPILSKFMLAHPRLTVELHLDDRVVDVVGEGFDLVIRIGTLENSTLAARRIADVRRVACASPAYLKERGTPKEPKDLVAHRGIAYLNVEDRKFWRFVNTKTDEEQIVSVPSLLKLNNGDAMREAAIAGYGIAALPTFIIHRAVVAGHLKCILKPFERPRIGMYAVYPTRRNAPAKVRTFVDFIVAQFGNSPYWDRDTVDKQ